MTWEESDQALHTKADVQDEFIQSIFKLKNKTFKIKYFNKIGNTNSTPRIILSQLFSKQKVKKQNHEQR